MPVGCSCIIIRFHGGYDVVNVLQMMLQCAYRLRIIVCLQQGNSSHDPALSLKLCVLPDLFVVQVVAIVGSSASQQNDTHSHQVAAATLGAVVPAWLQSGKPMTDLVAAVVAPLPTMLPHRRLPLLTALLAVVPQVRNNPLLLLLHLIHRLSLPLHLFHQPLLLG